MDFYDLFMYLAIFGGFLVAFSPGANDAANAFGPVMGIYLIAKHDNLVQQ